MNDNQKEALKKLIDGLNAVSEECYKDVEFNIQVAEVLQKNNITNMSLDDISYIINQQIQEKAYYADYDEDSQSYCVFGRDNGKAYASFADEEQAKNEANRMNHNI